MQGNWKREWGGLYDILIHQVIWSYFTVDQGVNVCCTNVKLSCASRQSVTGKVNKTTVEGERCHKRERGAQSKREEKADGVDRKKLRDPKCKSNQVSECKSSHLHSTGTHCVSKKLRQRQTEGKWQGDISHGKEWTWALRWSDYSDPRLRPLPNQEGWQSWTGYFAWSRSWPVRRTLTVCINDAATNRASEWWGKSC